MYILFYTTKPYELEVTYLQKKKKKKTMFELIKLSWNGHQVHGQAGSSSVLTFDLEKEKGGNR